MLADIPFIKLMEDKGETLDKSSNWSYWSEPNKSINNIRRSKNRRYNQQ
jgi:hypothetical protein